MIGDKKMENMSSGFKYEISIFIFIRAHISAELHNTYYYIVDAILFINYTF